MDFYKMLKIGINAFLHGGIPANKCFPEWYFVSKRLPTPVLKLVNVDISILVQSSMHLAYSSL